MPKDTDGTEWRSVRVSYVVEVMADNDTDARYYAEWADRPKDITLEVLD